MFCNLSLDWASELNRSRVEECPPNVWCCSDSCVPQIYSTHRTSTWLCCLQNISTPGKQSPKQRVNPNRLSYLSWDRALTLLQKLFSNRPLLVTPSFHSATYFKLRQTFTLWWKPTSLNQIWYPNSQPKPDRFILRPNPKTILFFPIILSSKSWR